MQPGAVPEGLTNRSCHTQVGVRAQLGVRAPALHGFSSKDFQRLVLMEEEAG
jgi:hypothetical protein